MLPGQTQVAAFIARLVHDDSAQDLIEYALLTGVIAVGSVVLFSQLADGLEAAYEGSNTASQSAWEPCAPGGCP